MSKQHPSSCSQLAIITRWRDQIALEQADLAARLDAGQWRLPLRTVDTSASCPPNPAFCGIELVHAATVQAWLAELDVTGIQKISLGSEQFSPSWYPLTLRVRVVTLWLDPQQQPSHSPTRCWQTADQILHRWQQGELLLNPFTQLILSESATTWAETNQEQAIHGLSIIPTRSHTLPPASHTNTLLLGDDQRWLVDPAPADAQAQSDLIAALEAKRPDGIFLTHHHLDHHQHCTNLARHWNIPIRCSRDTAERIARRFGKNYFEHCQMIPIQGGDTLCYWKNEPVIVHPIPGHDAGQLALQPESRRWMLVGDLIQGIGTVVIAEPEGNMQDYFKTLEWVIEQNPKAIIPSHGQVMGGTYRIAQTLAHRQLREQQILQQHELGHDVPSIVKTLYADVDSRLWPLAAMNVRSHLVKLEAEGLLQS